MKTVGYLVVLILPLLTSSIYTSPFLSPYHWNGGNFVLVRLIPEQNGQQPLSWSMPSYQNILRSGPYGSSGDSSGGSYGGSYGSSDDSYGAGSVMLPRYIRYLVDKIIYLRKEVLRLERLEPKCSSAFGENSLVLGSLCYTVVSAPSTLQEAFDYCFYKGGQIMQPYQQFSHVLYENLEHQFPLLFKLVKAQGHDQWWIGALSQPGSNDFSWLPFGNPVTPPPTFDPPLGDAPPAISRGIVLTHEGTKWKAVSEIELHPYVCWSTPV